MEPKLTAQISKLWFGWLTTGDAKRSQGVFFDTNT